MQTFSRAAALQVASTIRGLEKKQKRMKKKQGKREREIKVTEL